MISLRPCPCLAPIALTILLVACGGDDTHGPSPADATDDPTAWNAAPARPIDPDAASRTAAAQWLTETGSIAGEPTACVDGSGRLWAAWLAWAGDLPTLEVACFERDGERWNALATARVAEADRGLGLACLTAIGDGAYIAYESGEGAERVLGGRTFAFEGARLVTGEFETIARGGLSPDLVGLDDGSLVAVWQGLAGDAYDIWWRRRSAAGWQVASVSTGTPWDEWSPRAAAGPGGAVWLAWDAYVEGSFDVFCLGPLGTPDERLHRIAGSEGYEAYADLAVDAEGRPWIAYETASSFGVGGALRERRDVELVRLEADGAVRAAALDQSLAVGAQLPRIALDEDGLLLTVRRNDPPYFPEASKNTTNQGLHHAWTTWALRHEAGQWQARVVDGASGDNEETATLVVSGAEPFAVLAGDARREAFAEADLWVEVLEQDWRVGVTPLGTFGEQPRLGSARPSLPLPGVIAHEPRPSDPRWLFGDLHRHTHLSRCAGDADGTRLDTYRYARGPGRLDFVSITDHFQHLSRWSWWRSLRDVDRYHAPPSLIVLPGLERFLMRHGHQNLVYVDEDRARSDERVWVAAGDVPTSVARDDVVSIPHMMSTGINPFPLEALDPELHPVLELYQATRGSYEGPGSPYYARDLGRGPFVEELLGVGGPFGFIASADHGESDDAFAAIHDAEPTRRGVIEGLRARRTAAASAPSGATLSLDGVRGGAAGSVGARPSATVELGPGPAPVAAVELLVDGRVVARRGGQGGPELLVVSSKYAGLASDRPLLLKLDGARILGASPRRALLEGSGFEQVGQDTLHLWSAGDRIEVVLAVEWAGAKPSIGLRLRRDGERIPLTRLGLGETYRFETLPARNACVWRIGVPFDEPPASVTFGDVAVAPGAAVYARVAYRDGNVLWTSPAFVTEVEGQ